LIRRKPSCRRADKTASSQPFFAMYQKILVPIDGSATAQRGLREAIMLAGLCGSQLRIVHVVDALSLALTAAGTVPVTTDLADMAREQAMRLTSEAQAQARAAGLSADVALCERAQGRVCELVLAEAERWGADLIVLGTYGRRGPVRWLIGSDAEDIVRRAPVPVLLVRAPEPFESSLEEP
jgi:nucleotide-binding universal stress UspA family protein